MPSPGTLFDAVGGEPAVRALTEALHARCLDDPVLNHPFSHPGQNPDHVARLAAYLGEVLGGPARYSDECGDRSFMLDLHAHNGDVTELGARFLACFVAAADDAGLPEDRQLRDALRTHMAGAVDEVVAVGDVNAVVAPGLAVPRWGWLPDSPSPG
ncbi:MAG: group II truncated hemoglobin [Acidimicrobiales bacterium]